MYNRFDAGLHPSEPVGAIVGAVKDHVASLQDHAQHLRHRMTQIRTALSEKQKKGGGGGRGVESLVVAPLALKTGKENNGAGVL